MLIRAIFVSWKIHLNHTTYFITIFLTMHHMQYLNLFFLSSWNLSTNFFAWVSNVALRLWLCLPQICSQSNTKSSTMRVRPTNSDEVKLSKWPAWKNEFTAALLVKRNEDGAVSEVQLIEVVCHDFALYHLFLYISKSKQRDSQSQNPNHFLQLDLNATPERNP